MLHVRRGFDGDFCGGSPPLVLFVGGTVPRLHRPHDVPTTRRASRQCRLSSAQQRAQCCSCLAHLLMFVLPLVVARASTRVLGDSYSYLCCPTPTSSLPLSILLFIYLRPALPCLSLSLSPSCVSPRLSSISSAVVPVRAHDDVWLGDGSTNQDMTQVDLESALPQTTVMVVSVTGSTTSGQPLSEQGLRECLKVGLGGFGLVDTLISPPRRVCDLRCARSGIMWHFPCRTNDGCVLYVFFLFFFA